MKELKLLETICAGFLFGGILVLVLMSINAYLPDKTQQPQTNAVHTNVSSETEAVLNKYGLTATATVGVTPTISTNK